MTFRPTSRTLAFGLGLAIAALLGGCAGYQWGDTAELPFRTIHIAAPVNMTLAPQAAALLGTQVARKIEESGRAELAPPASADTELKITIADFRRDISADRGDDTGLARKWRLTLKAECTLTDTRSGKILFEKREVSAFDEVYSDSGSVAAEYQNMPVLTDKLATAIAREVLAVW